MMKIMCSTVVTLVLVSILTTASVTTVNGQLHHVDMKVIQGGGDAGRQCPSAQERDRALNEIHQTVDNFIINTSMTSYTYVCDGTSGWRRVAFINMTDTSYSCPPGLNLTTYSKRTCGRAHTGNYGCSSTTFSVGGLPYSQVCGRIRGYQLGVLASYFSNRNGRGIDEQYVDGVVLTHGGSSERQHIWTFAAGLTQYSGNPYPYEMCPCDTSNYPDFIPSFVGNDYFCESGLQTDWYAGYYYHNFYPNNTLWDGENCIASSTCCQFNHPPWFTKHLNGSTCTTDDIELRLCMEVGASYSADVALELIELYVK